MVDDPMLAAILREASLASGPSGFVDAGATLTFDEAVKRRAAGLDVVVCGDDLAENRRLAASLEAAVGQAPRPQPPHKSSAGPRALPHFHQRSRVPPGHTFYETPNLRARK
jgi:hypothetical protein